jgi:Tfp pilus assembly protein PilX
MQVYTISQSNRSAHHHAQGFALVATVSMMVLMTLIAIGMLSLSTIEQRSSGGGANDADRMARANARMALMIALGELQKAAGPDQRVTATATILGSATNPYATGTTAADGRKHWLGVWNTNGYSPADPDNKTFVRWLVSGDQNQLDTIADADTAAADDFAIFEGVDAAGNADPASTVKVPKVEVATATPGNSSYYAYWVEDEGVKVDLAWNQGSFTDADREQAARLSTAPGPDHSVFSGPFATGVSHPLASGSGYIDKLEKSFSPADMPLVMADTADHSEWLKANRHNMAMNVRGVIADVKKGGLRRDLSLAFEMDDTAESESATLFNQQTAEFVGDPANGDLLSSPIPMPGESQEFLNNDPANPLYARHLFRDYGADSVAGTPGAGNAFSEHILQPTNTLRGPSWWLLRDYANLYKRMKTSGSGHALSARAYFPNQNTHLGKTADGNPRYGNFIEVHSLWNAYETRADKRLAYGVSSVSSETDGNGSVYSYRPVRANYSPVLLGVNVIFSLKYNDAANRLELLVDPFFIIWNPYNTHISADKFAINWTLGFHGGFKFVHTYPDTTTKLYGSLDTNFARYADNKIGDAANAGDVSYLISGLTMEPGEVMLYSPPSGERGADANELHDKLEPGMNYDNDSGIKFHEFPYAVNPYVWGEVSVPSSERASHTIDTAFSLKVNTRNTGSEWNQGSTIETHLPAPGTDANQLTTKASFGKNLGGSGFRIRHYGGRSNSGLDPNLDWGPTAFQGINYTFQDLASKSSFAMMTMLTLPTDCYHRNPPWWYKQTDMEVFSQLNVTPIVRTRVEAGNAKKPLNLFILAQCKDNINALMQDVGIDIDAWNSGNNGFYGKNYSLNEGDRHLPLIDIPKAPMHSLVQLSGANIGVRLFEPTNAIGNSWKPPYIPQDSIYSGWGTNQTINDVSWQVNDALFDRYYLSGIAPEYTIGTSGYDATGGSLNKTLKRFYGIDPDDPTQTVDPATAQANPALEPHVPSGKTSDDIVTELAPTSTNHDGYQKTAAYSLIKGAFNVNSTSVQAWRAFLQGNKALALESAQGTTDSGAGTPFPLSSTISDTSSNIGSNNGWEKFSRLTDDQIWDDNDTANDLTDDTGLAVEIVNQIKARGPFMSISDFVNRRIAEDKDPTTGPYVEDTDPRAYLGAIQEAIEQAGINGDQSTGIRSQTSDRKPNYNAGTTRKFVGFDYAGGDYLGNRNNATGVPMEINQANILLPLAPRLSARSDTFRIRAYGEVRDADDNIIASAICEAVVQRLPEYVDAETDPDNNEPWDDDSQTPTLNTINQTYGRRFEIRSFRWLDQSEV